MTIHRTQKKKGFTIVETLVAISILMLAITGPLLIISQALKASFFSRSQITAFYLAQEAVEYIRNVKDQTSLSLAIDDTEWLDLITGGTSCESGSKRCVNAYDAVDPQAYKFNLLYGGSGYELVDCESSGCAPLTYDDLIQGGVIGDAVPYGGDGTANSIFTRTIWLTTVPGDPRVPDDYSGVPHREVVVHVAVTWKQGTADYRFVLESHLLNWKLEQ